MFDKELAVHEASEAESSESWTVTDDKIPESLKSKSDPGSFAYSVIGVPQMITVEAMLYPDVESECLKILNEAEMTEYDQDCPPMPFMMYPLFVYQIGNNTYQLLFRASCITRKSP